MVWTLVDHIMFLWFRSTVQSSKHSLHSWNAEEMGSTSELIGLGVSARTFTDKEEGETNRARDSCSLRRTLFKMFVFFPLKLVLSLEGTWVVLWTESSKCSCLSLSKNVVWNNLASGIKQFSLRYKITCTRIITSVCVLSPHISSTKIDILIHFKSLIFY